VEEVADAVRLGALEHEVLQEAIDAVGHPLRLGLVRLPAKRLGHRAGLVDQEQQTRRIRAANFGSVRHGKIVACLSGVLYPQMTPIPQIQRQKREKTGLIWLAERFGRQVA
jgi:hypothetical protein